MRIATLYIEAVQHQDAGRYQCEAENEKGVSTQSVWLDVYGECAKRSAASQSCSVLLDLLLLSCVKLKSMKCFLLVPKTTYCTFKSLPECEVVYFPKSQAFSEGTCGVIQFVSSCHFSLEVHALTCM